ncbi:sigma factor [Actinomadura sp. KC06]|uniref:sigma factor n=1 Tax=Actinomadura sp. KC06 TaxID=2530369 RepID=UPI001FB5CE14|nr:sigma factor [Actinomadura sp. KC06]
MGRGRYRGRAIRPGGRATGKGRRDPVEEFEELRPLLFSISYRILGSVSEAEDAVQETWLWHELSPARPKSGQGVPVGRGDPDLHRRAALCPGAAGDVRRAVVSRAAADRPLPGPRALGGAGRLSVDGGPAVRRMWPRCPPRFPSLIRIGAWWSRGR